MRLCPRCGKKCEEARCPDDGTATLVLAANPDARLAEGTEVNGRYRIRQMIGQGGFGAVYKATNIATDQDMAIKLLAVSLDTDESDVIQRFFAEAQVTASLKHPNTIRVFDFGQTEGGALYIAMELLSGRPLNDVLKRRAAEGKTLTEEETITIGVQVLRSLAEAHGAKLVHRDLKPHNVFLHEVEGDDPVVKVLDFGIAKRLGSNLTGTGKAFGTPSYMSPEQAQNQVLDNRSDLYSLGCVLYQCVAGKAPFEGDDPLAVLLSHVTKTAPDLRQAAGTPLSEAFVAVLEKAMAKDPDERFATAIAFRQALEACRGRNRTELARAASTEAIAELMAGEAERQGAAAGGGDERTVAYSAATPHGLTPRVAPLPGQPAAAARAPSGKNQALGEPEEVGAPEPTPVAKRPSSVWIVAGAAALAAVLAVVALSAGKEKTAPEPAPGLHQPESAPPAVTAAPAETPAATPVAGPPPAPEPVKTPRPAGATEPPPAAATGATEPPPAAAAGVSAAATQVRLESEPTGATVLIGGETAGKTPMAVTVPPGGRVSALLRLAGHRDLEIEVSAADAPQKSVRMTPAAPPKASGPGKKPTPDRHERKGPSTLDERI